jgi:hypothetical protein
MDPLQAKMLIASVDLGGGSAGWERQGGEVSEQQGRAALD